MPMPKVIAGGIDPAPLNDLIFHGGKVTPNMHYKNFYLGGNPSWAEQDVVSIDTALESAMKDTNLNNVMKQYFPGAKISCDFHGSEILPGAKPRSFNEPDVHALLKKLHAEGGLKGFDLKNSIFNFLLPSGTVLKLDRDSSLTGLGGYHGSVHVKTGGVETTLYYSVGVFSEFLPNRRENGIVAFDKPWKNVVGTFYHELNEYRTDADVDDAIRNNNNDFLGWMSRDGEEIGDNPISAAAGADAGIRSKADWKEDDRAGAVHVLELCARRRRADRQGSREMGLARRPQSEASRPENRMRPTEREWHHSSDPIESLPEPCHDNDGFSVLLHSKPCRWTLLLLAAMILIAFNQTAPAQQINPDLFRSMRWRSIGPFRGGRTRAVAGVPSQPNVFYIAQVNGGVFKTIDYGHTWMPIFDEQPTGSVGCIAVANSNPDVIYVGSGEGLHRPDLSVGDGVYKSTDAGKTWAHLGLRDGQQIPQIAVDPRNADHLLVAVAGHPYGPNEERGIFRSTDGGQTFTKVLYKDENIGGADVLFDPTNSEIAYASLWEAARVPGKTAPGTEMAVASLNPQTGARPGNNCEGTTRHNYPGESGDLFQLTKTPDCLGSFNRRRQFFRSDDAGESWAIVTTDPRPAGRIGRRRPVGPAI